MFQRSKSGEQVRQKAILAGEISEIFMHRQKTLWLLIFCLFLPLPVIAQGMAENGGLYSSMAGLGAGLAASQRHGAVVGRSYQAVINAQQAAIIQSQAITQYMRQGCEFEATKQWLNAEKSFKYVLRVIAMRDGPGSRNSLPVLEHLVTVTKAQNKLKEATDFQSTVVAFTKAGKTPDYNAVVSQQMNLSNLYIEQEDYANAEPVLKSAIQVYDSCPTLSKERRKDIITSYSKVLKKLHKQDPKIDEKI